MLAVSMWNLDPTKILLRHELAAVLADLNLRAERSLQARLNRAIFRLACCCGLRVSEIGGLRLADVCLAGPRPHLRIRACNAKGGRSRRVPLWWDAGTLSDIAAWRAERVVPGLPRRRPVHLLPPGPSARPAPPAPRLAAPISHGLQGVGARPPMPITPAYKLQAAASRPACRQCRLCRKLRSRGVR